MKDKRNKVKQHHHQHIADVFSCIPLHLFSRSLQAIVDNKIFITDRRFRLVNPLTPNDHYSGRTASLTSKRCILYIYSTNTGTNMVYTLRVFLFKMQFVS